MPNELIRTKMMTVSPIRRRSDALRLSLVAAAVLMIGGCVTASADSEPMIDKSFGKFSGWDVGFSSKIGGCLAAGTYRDRTTVRFGFVGDKVSAYIAFSNPQWRSIEVDGRYYLQLVMGGTNWHGEFIGFGRHEEKGVFSVDLKPEFMVELAESGGVKVLLNRRRITTLSLDGSRHALEAVISCQKAYLASYADNQGAGEKKPRTPSSTEGGSSGTGFFVSTSGHVVTNHHVIGECSAIKVIPVGGAESEATVIAKDKTNDLAILKTSLTPSQVPALRPQLRLGEAVYVYGFPLKGLLSTSGNFTAGAITATTGMEDDTRQAQFSAPVQPGNSGGPLLDKYGNVVGVIASKLNALNVAATTQDIPQNLNFAIKASIAANFIDTSNVSTSGTVSSRELPPEAIADLAKLFTVQVVCD